MRNTSSCAGRSVKKQYHTSIKLLRTLTWTRRNCAIGREHRQLVCYIFMCF